MQSGRRPDAIDTRIVFWVYASLAALGGLTLLVWGPMWFGADRAQSAIIRVFGAILIAAGCFATALAAVEDPASRRRGLLWFAIGHLVVMCVVAVVFDVIRGPALWVALALLNAAVFALFYFWQTTEGDPPPGLLTPLTTLFGGGASTTERLRSRYEQQIRLAATQEERNRLARDLHDLIKQQIFVIQTAAATAEVRFDHDPTGAKQALSQVRNSARDAMSELEVMLDQLRAEPLENTGLVEALKKQCEALGFRTGAHVEFLSGQLPGSGSLVPGAHEAILRVAQEALSNVARHARAKNVHVNLDSAAGRFQLRIRDDGAGFDTNQAARGMGIENLRARAKEFGGEFDLASCPGWGTSVKFSIPYVQGAPEVYRRQVLISGAVILAAIFGLVFTKSPVYFAIGLASVIMFTRQFVAWRRTRRLGEASS